MQPAPGWASLACGSCGGAGLLRSRFGSWSRAPTAQHTVCRNLQEETVVGYADEMHTARVCTFPFVRSSQAAVCGTWRRWLRWWPSGMSTPRRLRDSVRAASASRSSRPPPTRRRRRRRRPPRHYGSARASAARKRRGRTLCFDGILLAVLPALSLSLSLQCARAHHGCHTRTAVDDIMRHTPHARGARCRSVKLLGRDVAGMMARRRALDLGCVSLFETQAARGGWWGHVSQSLETVSTLSLSLDREGEKDFERRNKTRALFTPEVESSLTAQASERRALCGRESGRRPRPSGIPLNFQRRRSRGH